MSNGPALGSEKIRVDAGVSLLYPASADTRGRARVVVNQRTYYFGQHGTAVSYAMFARWKQELESGRNDSLPSSFRDDVAVFLRTKLRRWPSPSRVLTTLCIGFACTCLGVGIASRFSSSPSASQVDGIEMSARETEYVRALRTTGAMQIANFPTQRVAEIANQISKDGFPDAPPPRISAKPPIPSHD